MRAQMHSTTAPNSLVCTPHQQPLLLFFRILRNTLHFIASIISKTTYGFDVFTAHKSFSFGKGKTKACDSYLKKSVQMPDPGFQHVLIRAIL